MDSPEENDGHEDCAEGRVPRVYATTLPAGECSAVMSSPTNETGRLSILIVARSP